MKQFDNIIVLKLFLPYCILGETWVRLLRIFDTKEGKQVQSQSSASRKTFDINSNYIPQLCFTKKTTKEHGCC